MNNTVESTRSMLILKAERHSFNTKCHKDSPQSAGPAKYLPADHLETNPHVSTMQTRINNSVYTLQSSFTSWVFITNIDKFPIWFNHSLIL